MATGTIKNNGVSDATQTITSTSGGKTTILKFYKKNGIVFVNFSSTGGRTFNAGGWMPFATGLNSDFIADDNIIVGCNGNTLAWEFTIFGANSANAGEIQILVGSGSASYWLEGCFSYFTE